MPRRSHKKSRQGCAECKRRHIKCDETSGRCINCVTARLKCPYESERQAESIPTPGLTVNGGRSASASSLDTPASSPHDLLFNAPIVQRTYDPTLNLLHLELLHHWSSFLHHRSFVADGVPERLYADISIKHGLQCPFLMRQILAISALHLSTARPNQRAFYHQHAAQLQSEALSGFNAALQNIDENNILPAFLVSSLVGLYAFCETFHFRNDNFNDVMDSLISCINLLRGVRLVIADWWPYLLASELNPILKLSTEAMEEPKGVSLELDDLKVLLTDAEIGENTREIYRTTLIELRKVFVEPSSLRNTNPETSSNIIFAWLVVSPKEYVEALEQRRPEALVILAYYAVVLNRRRRFWAIGDAGRFLIEGISAHLGRHWDHWLSWPRSEILEIMEE